MKFDLFGGLENGEYNDVGYVEISGIFYTQDVFSKVRYHLTEYSVPDK